MDRQKLSLSEALEELEQVVERLNSGNVDVEQGLKEFQRGVELVEQCRGALKHAENQFVELKKRLGQESEQESLV